MKIVSVVFCVMVVWVGCSNPFAKSREKAIRCENNLKMIGLFMRMHCDVYGVMPSSFDMVLSHIADKNVMECPEASVKYDFFPGVTGKKCTYFDKPAEIPAAMCVKHGIVLYVDGHVGMIPANSK